MIKISRNLISAIALLLITTIACNEQESVEPTQSIELDNGNSITLTDVSKPKESRTKGYFPLLLDDGIYHGQNGQYDVYSASSTTIFEGTWVYFYIDLDELQTTSDPIYMTEDYGIFMLTPNSFNTDVTEAQYRNNSGGWSTFVDGQVSPTTFEPGKYMSSDGEFLIKDFLNGTYCNPNQSQSGCETVGGCGGGWYEVGGKGKFAFFRVKFNNPTSTFKNIQVRVMFAPYACGGWGWRFTNDWNKWFTRNISIIPN